MNEGDSIKKDYWLTFSGMYFSKYIQGLAFGASLEKTTVRSRVTQVSSFYNTYKNNFKSDASSASRLSSLTFGWNYNFLEKNKLNLGIQQGVFLYDSYTLTYGTYHSFGVELCPQIEYRYCLKRIEIGINTMLPLLFGRYKRPIYYNSSSQQPYERGYNLNAFLLFNLSLSVKL